MPVKLLLIRWVSACRGRSPNGRITCWMLDKYKKDQRKARKFFERFRAKQGAEDKPPLVGGLIDLSDVKRSDQHEK